jgi:hypothetical protein
MIALFRHLIGGSSTNGKLSLALTVDHVELSETHLVLGLGIDWHNRTDDPMPIKEVQIRVYVEGRHKEPLRFYPLERFARVMALRALEKKPVRPFVLPPDEIHTEQIRFISQAIIDIPPGSYVVEVETKDSSDAVYINKSKIHLESKLKYRRSEEWSE